MKKMSDNWERIENAESTIAHFIDGWRHPEGAELIIWKGVTHEGEIEIETHLHDTAPEGAEFVLEEKYGDELLDEHFSETEDGIRTKAEHRKNMIEQFLDKITDEVVENDNDKTSEENGEIFDDVREKPAGMSLNDLEPIDIIFNLVNDVKNAKVAAGEVKGVFVVLKLYNIREETNEAWRLKAESEKEVGNNVTAGGAIGLEYSNDYDKPGDAILDFNALVKRYGLEELTNPDKELDYLTEEDIE